MKTYGEILKKIREEQGLSQSELAAACKIPVGTVRNHEQGRHDISIANLFAYSQALQVECTVFKAGRPAGEVKKKKQERKARKRPT